MRFHGGKRNLDVGKDASRERSQMGEIVKSKRFMATASVIALIHGVHDASAQATKSESKQKSTQQTIEEVVVTAEKRSEDVQKVPVAVSVVSGAELQNQHVFDPSQFQYLVPSLQQETANNQVGAANFFIRGVGTAIFGPAVESSVSTVIDDVALGRPTLGVAQLFDIDHVEVLRGPQGELFGKNASAGVVNIVTKKPELGAWDEIVHLSYGNANDGSAGNEVVAQGVLNIPVSEESAARISAFVTRQDGFAKNIFRDEDLGSTEFGARVKYLWQPTERWEVYFSADYAHEGGAASSVLVRRFDAPGGFIAAEDALAGITASGKNTKVAGDAPTSNNFDLGGAQIEIVYSFGGGYSLTDIAAVRAYQNRSSLDTDILPIDFFNINRQGRNQTQVSNELRLASPAGGVLEYQIGFYYLHIRDEGLDRNGADLQPVFPPPPPGFSLIGNAGSSTIHNSNYAGFGQAKLALFDQFRLIFGGRVIHDDLDGTGTNSVSCCLIPLSPPGTLSGGFSRTNYSIKTGFEWNVTPDALAYFTYARGYKSPTFGGTTGLDVIKAEIPHDAELGFKSSWLDNRLVANLALFWTKFDNFQAQAFDPTLQRFTTTNAGSLLEKGVELEFQALPFEGLSVNGGVTYNEATYQSLSVPCYFGEPAAPSGRNVCLPNGTSVATGNQLMLAPRWVGLVSADYERPMGYGLNGFVAANYYYRSTVFYTAAHDPRTRVGGLGILGGSVGIETDDGHIRASVFARNLLDKRFPTLIVADVLSPIDGDASLGGDYYQQFGETSFRTIGVSLDLRY